MLSNGLRRRTKFMDREDVNPMEGAVNIVDAMLVFACGLMLSLVIYWNVDLHNKDLVPVSQGENMTEVEGMQQEIEDSQSGDGLYERLGTVYVDHVSGKMYLIQEDEETQNTTEAALSKGQ